MPSVRLKDYVTHTIKSGPLVRSPFQSNSLGTLYPIANYVSYDKLSLMHRSFLANITARHEPTIYAETKKEECWRDAMRKEIQALKDNRTWTVVDLPPGKKVIRSK